MTGSAADARFMARALQLARRGLYTTDPNPRVGCVVVKDDRIVGLGWHARAGEPHAEVFALREAGEQARGATVYVTLEPCCHHGRTPPCVQALVQAGVARVIAAMHDPDPRVLGQGVAELEHRGIAVTVGLMQSQAETLNPGFLSRMRRQRPYVRVKLAASLDGRTALVAGQSKWITGAAARADVQRWRARSSAIMTGIGTVLADDPGLDVRDIDCGRQPLRVVLDSRARMSAGARMLQRPGRTLVFTSGAERARRDALRGAGAEVLDVGPPGIDLASVLGMLAQREVNEVLVEAGATLSGALLQADLVDELLLYYAPHILGSAERPMFALPPLGSLDGRRVVTITDVRAMGDDWRVTARRVSPSRA